MKKLYCIEYLVFNIEKLEKSATKAMKIITLKKKKFGNQRKTRKSLH